MHGAFPQKSIAGAVGAILGNAPYKIGDRTAVTHLKSNIVGFRCLNPTYKIGDRTTRSAIAIKKKHRQSSVPV
ncbi:MAG: hypothetical protein EWV53_03140 [Microcystis panniformis Mp_MB_F_20051200_S9]|uniref:Uncharacterized protein n=1 Tax=Microcystis panniformis Mp_MB_F_20051200_S9 TaxID=2486223 RepID=A0A552Q916_9CHRO|nr:MAG: hypothetical protein EWV42_22010 [Microcystis panniformis Mp_GB_SS_20050300_S99D]TRV44399.1 MAG: hypothetical protein EWV87_19390 [Microcystis panniformis Mp_GB_SS_20050300_S99]TRV45009.1 MAG: hypothetical protein EWV43_17690 [Microcystis panniformis Mp_MB_F_20080800_S26D]TRV56866.1 MAG: hypothetical protein EWV69_17090 [Microcystis panniformis Mp_MB_F_20080800_S26]TRV61358.1 MAG: hypothetical protein EWV86_15095 [Microcystis panniformis Mp_MB_F_20051200_S9D]TRV65707.1 MAG: hypothetica